MTETLKIVGPQMVLATVANTVSNATVVRVLNTDAGLVTITVANSGVNVGTITLVSNAGEYIKKYAHDTLVSNNATNVLATPIAFSG